MYCKCGCGQKTKLAKWTDPRWGHIKGEPLLYILGHQFNKERHWKWNGGKTTNTYGYPRTNTPGHPRADRHGYVFDNILVAEKVFGRPIPEKAIVHHVDGNKKNNSPTNLVICQDHAYHMLIHARMRAFKACGHAGWVKCRYCKEYDDPQNLHIRKGKTYHDAYHKNCAAKYQRSKTKTQGVRR